MMKEAYDIWANLEEESGTTMYKSVKYLVPYIGRGSQHGGFHKAISDVSQRLKTAVKCLNFCSGN